MACGSTKMKRCIKHVIASGKSKKSAGAICKVSLTGKKKRKRKRKH